MFYCDPFDGTVYDWDNSSSEKRGEKGEFKIWINIQKSIINNNKNSSHTRILYRIRKVINPMIFKYNDLLLNQLSDLTGPSDEL